MILWLERPKDRRLGGVQFEVPDRFNSEGIMGCGFAEDCRFFAMPRTLINPYQDKKHCEYQSRPEQRDRRHVSQSFWLNGERPFKSASSVKEPRAHLSCLILRSPAASLVQMPAAGRIQDFLDVEDYDGMYFSI